MHFDCAVITGMGPQWPNPHWPASCVLVHSAVHDRQQFERLQRQCVYRNSAASLRGSGISQCSCTDAVTLRFAESQPGLIDIKLSVYARESVSVDRDPITRLVIGNSHQKEIRKSQNAIVRANKRHKGSKQRNDELKACQYFTPPYLSDSF